MQWNAAERRDELRQSVVPRTITMKELDQRVIDNLKGLRSDLKKPHAIDFFLYIPSEEGAYKVAAEMRKRRFDVDVYPPGPRADWSVIGVKSMRPNLVNIGLVREWLTSLAESYGGEFDGWGTAVED